MNQEQDSESTSWFSGPETATSFLKFNEQFKAESDRGAVIVGAALIDELLKELLKARLVPSNVKEDALFDITYAPLHDLRAKIDFAYRVGVIRKPVHSSLQLLRKLRNDFAHSSVTLNFNSPTVQDRIRELFKLNCSILDALFESFEDELKNSDNEEVRVIFTNESQEHSTIEKLLKLLGWRGLFDLLTALTCAALKQLPNQVEQIKSPEPID